MSISIGKQGKMATNSSIRTVHINIRYADINCDKNTSFLHYFYGYFSETLLNQGSFMLYCLVLHLTAAVFFIYRFYFWYLNTCANYCMKEALAFVTPPTKIRHLRSKRFLYRPTCIWYITRSRGLNYQWKSHRQSWMRSCDFKVETKTWLSIYREIKFIFLFKASHLSSFCRAPTTFLKPASKWIVRFHLETTKRQSNLNQTVKKSDAFQRRFRLALKLFKSEINYASSLLLTFNKKWLRTMQIKQFLQLVI